MRRALLLGAISIACAGGACRSGTHSHSHDHGHQHPEKEEEREPLDFTRWSNGYELFVELPAPKPGESVAYHAHVTRLDGFAAVSEGRFTVRYKSGSSVASEASIEGVARPGIFTPKGNAPPAGKYALEMVYEHRDARAVFDCGEVTIADAAPAESAHEDEGIAFTKEAQWKIPFATDWAEERALAREVELPAIVEPAGSEQLAISAPTGGRFFHNAKLSLAPGTEIAKGELLGRVAPMVAGDDFSRLEFAVDDARLAKQQVEREIERVRPLVKDGLLPEKRVIELENELARESGRLRAARERMARVVSPGGGGGLALRAGAAGVIADVLVPNGEPVEPGTTVVRLRGSGEIWVRARFVARPAGELGAARPRALRLSDGRRLELSESRARLISTEPVVDPKSRLATWVVEIQPDEAAAESARLPVPGSHVVLLLRVGEPKKTLAVPAGAVVEIDTRPYVFVQHGGEQFEKRHVVLGHRDGGFIAIESGVAKGERIVTRGGFDIHLASLLGAVESHRH